MPVRSQSSSQFPILSSQKQRLITENRELRTEAVSKRRKEWVPYLATEKDDDDVVTNLSEVIVEACGSEEFREILGVLGRL